jgi:hypothetical protein
MDYDLALLEQEGALCAHKPDCPIVQEHREQGRPVFTMIGCSGKLPGDLKLHSCLTLTKTRAPTLER